MRTPDLVLLTDHHPPRTDPQTDRPGGFGFQPRSRRAFTLVELVMVLFIAVIMAAIAVPRWGLAAARYRADALGRRIAADIDRTRLQALATSTAHAVSFDVAQNAYIITGVRSLDRASSDTTLKLDQPPYNATLASADFGGGSVLLFNGFGYPVQAGEVQFTVGPQRRAVSVEARTGIVRVYRVGGTLGSPVRDVLYTVASAITRSATTAAGFIGDSAR